LHDWLSNLTVHRVQGGKLQVKMRARVAKKRRKRKSDEMQDFIADSEDENFPSTPTGKNAILLTGPSGSGKTASVYAVAQQLGFEVFEIHPGMKRSARDIQERVGDMTQNHLVQHADTSSRRSSVSVDSCDASLPSLDVLPPSQQTMAAFMGIGKKGKGGSTKKPLGERNDGKEAKPKSQKQSLILLEEVDILFDEDKGFWSGVQSLISTSKRPVILTCNDISAVPVEDLDMFAVLSYEAPEPDLAVRHLQYMAAAEGHLLREEAVANLYLSKARDLRASATELNFWCQMTVGSQQGGLDWMVPHKEKMRVADQDGSVARIVSQDTFFSGLDLLPVELNDAVQVIEFSQDCLGISASDWVEDAFGLEAAGLAGLSALDDAFRFADARSALDLMDASAKPLLAGTMKQMSTSPSLATVRDDVVGLYMNRFKSATGHTTKTDVASALEPLMEDNRIGLPRAPSRKAPSIDTFAAQSLVVDVAPYVRAIVAQDQRLQFVREELDQSSQTNKRQRRTRASRAAVEGGDKSTTRRDKWFPESLDFAAVLGTGGNGWPQVRPDEVSCSPSADTPADTPASSTSMATES
jgi:sorting nexin-8